MAGSHASGDITSLTLKISLIIDLVGQIMLGLCTPWKENNIKCRSARPNKWLGLTIIQFYEPGKGKVRGARCGLFISLGEEVRPIKIIA